MTTANVETTAAANPAADVRYAHIADMDDALDADDYAAIAAAADRSVAAMYAELYAELGNVDGVMDGADYADIHAAAAVPTWAEVADAEWYWTFAPRTSERQIEYYSDDAAFPGFLTVTFADVDAARFEDWHALASAEYENEDGVSVRWTFAI